MGRISISCLLARFIASSQQPSSTRDFTDQDGTHSAPLAIWAFAGTHAAIQSFTFYIVHSMQSYRHVFESDATDSFKYTKYTM